MRWTSHNPICSCLALLDLPFARVLLWRADWRAVRMCAAGAIRRRLTPAMHRRSVHRSSVPLVISVGASESGSGSSGPVGPVMRRSRLWYVDRSGSGRPRGSIQKWVTAGSDNR